MEPPRYPRLLQDALLVSAAAHHDKIAVVAEGRSYGYGRLLDEALRLARGLIDLGLRRGDRVAIYLDNGWPAVVAIYGTLLAGGVIMVVNPQTKADKLAFMLGDSEAGFLVADGRLARNWEAAAARYGLRVIVSGPYAPDAQLALTAALHDWDALIANHPPLEAPPATVPVDLAALIYTSGSTGNPKGVMMTHQSMVFTQGSLVEYLRLAPDERILNLLPLAFDYGLYQLLMTVQLGATLILEASFNYPAAVLKRVEEERATVFPGVPTVFATLLSLHRRDPRRFETVRRVTNTAAHLPDDFVPGLRQVFPEALIFKMYGLTECKRVCYLEPELIDQKPGSVGRAIPGTEAFLLREDGTPAAPGETGILHVRGPHVMAGYWRRPDLSAEMLVPGPVPGERVLCTHDRFRLDADGFLYFVGRSDDIIKTRGEKVSPIEVENALHGIPGVREAAVVGVPDELLGEAVRAYVVVEPDSGLTGPLIRRSCMARLEGFMVPREVVLVEDLPKTATGKVRKKSLLGDPGLPA